MSTILREYVAGSRLALRDALLELLPEQGSYPSGIPGVSFHRFNTDEPPKPLIYAPVLIVVVQGSKWVRIGTEEFIYGNHDGGDHTCFVAGIDMPVFCRVKEASPEKPYLSLTMDLDHSLLAWLTALDRAESGYDGFSLPGARVHGIDDAFLDACLRLVNLAAKPEQIPFLAPLFREEIHYRLLLGPFGRQLRTLYTAGSWGNRMAEAVNWLGRNYRRRLRVATLAGQAGMAATAFCENFTNVTTVSPLEYQKRLRLDEARRLLLCGNSTTAEAAFTVGYGTQERFSREYGQLFGESPESVIVQMP